MGDPFKDTSGPSMNILIKLMSIVSLIIAPHIYAGDTIEATEIKTDPIKTEVKSDIQLTKTSVTTEKQLN